MSADFKASKNPKSSSVSTNLSLPSSEVFTGAIYGTSWNDLNGNGVFDWNEPGLADWVIYLDQNQNGQLDQGEIWTLTDDDGEYAFAELAPGTYTVAEVLPPGWQQTFPGDGNGNGGSSGGIFLDPEGDTFGRDLVQLDIASAPVRYAIERAAALEQPIATTASPQTMQWVVGLKNLDAAQQLADRLGVTNLGATGHLPNAVLWESSEPQDWASLTALSGVEFAFPLVTRKQEHRAIASRFIPNDPLFAAQWHLLNNGQFGGTAGADANIQQAWDIAQGAGVVIGIVDDGLQYTHPDLAAQYRRDLSYDFNDDDPIPLPGIWNSHGTAVAGVAAATGNNGSGISGAAPQASLAGLRLLGGWVSDLLEANALTYKNQEIHIYSNSWGPYDDGASLEAPGPLTLAALEAGVKGGRGGLGSIYVWAAGNGLQWGDNVNYDGYANSRYTIAVSAIDHNGVQSAYSEPGAPILVAAYSSGDEIGITTTDLSGSFGYEWEGDYTYNFGGTSSAAPLVSGVVALMLEANPTLTWRDVQHILVETAQQNDPLDADWRANGAGYFVNHKYGFGAIDAFEAVTTAQAWTSVAPEVSFTSAVMEIGTAIPDGSLTGLTSTVTVSQAIAVEWVEVVFDASHSYRGDLQVVLRSPDGTESILAEPRADFNDDYNSWLFSSARHWGESSVGDWTLEVLDTLSGDSGLWNFWQLNLYGTSTDPVSNRPGTYTVTLGPGEVVTHLDFGNIDLSPPVDDLIEPNDTIALAIATGLSSITPGTFSATSFIGNNPNIPPADDVDMFAVQLNAGDRLTVDINADVLGSTLDSVLVLFTSAGEVLALSDDDPAPGEEPYWYDSYLDFVATTPDTYYVGVSGYSNFFYDPFLEGSGRGLSTGSYDITLQVTPGSSGPGGSDPIFGTPGDDEINVVGRDRLVFAGAGDDLIDASSGRGGNRLYGGSGDDVLIAGTGDRLSGGAGRDRLFATGGDNLLTGGAGADQFWVATGEIPDHPNIVTDFEAGIDVIGIGGLELALIDLSLSQFGGDTLIRALGQDLAILNNIQASSLTHDSFVFA